MTDPIDKIPEPVFEPIAEPRKPHLFRGLRNRFLTGLVVALPLFITISGISWIVGKVDKYVLGLIPESWVINPWLSIVLGLPGLGLIVVVISLVILGTLASNFIGTSVIKAGERLLARVPVVSNVYNFMKQIVVTVAQQSDRSFKEVCLIEYPAPRFMGRGFCYFGASGRAETGVGRGLCLCLCSDYTKPDFGLSSVCKTRGYNGLGYDAGRGRKNDYFWRHCYL